MKASDLITLVICSVCAGYVAASDVPCAARWEDEGQGYICVCNSSYCDTVDTPEKLASGMFYWYKTSNSSPGFTQSTGGFLRPLLDSFVDGTVFTIDSSVTYQKIVGFGGAVTDSSGININTLPENAQTKLVESYFGPAGIEYTILRVPIGGTDFSTRVYTLDDVPLDTNLENFSLAEEDLELRVPFIKKAVNISQRDINIMGCSWIAPAWMKINDTDRAQYVQEEFEHTWAQYHIRFLEEYRKQGLEVWALSGGNEVVMLLMAGGFQGLLNFTLATAPTQRSWLKTHLKPLLASSNFSDVKFVTLDDERVFAPYWMERFANDPEAYASLDGIALHTYFDKYSSTTLLDDLHKAYPDKMIMYTETSINTSWGSNAVLLGSWDRAVIYLSSLFENLSHWSVTYLDWNLALNLDGGPSRSYNIDGAVIVNETSGEFYKQPIFYAMGHFSKFVPPGAVRVQVVSNQNESSTRQDRQNKRSKEALRELMYTAYELKLSPGEVLRGRPEHELQDTTSSLQCLAFSNPDGSCTVIVLNTADEDASVTVQDDRVGSAFLQIEKQSINTFVYWP